MATAQSTAVAQSILNDFIKDRVFMNQEKLHEHLNHSYRSIKNERLTKWSRRSAKKIIKDRSRTVKKYGTVPELAAYLDKCFIEKNKTYS
jgi:hypothetical protein